MYEYLRALKDRFSPAPKNPQLIQEIEDHRQAFARRIDKQGRKELLRLIDAQSALQSEIALENFVAGFRLARGIDSELDMQEPYSYTGVASSFLFRVPLECAAEKEYNICVTSFN